MVKRLFRWLSPTHRRAMAKRRLQEVAREAGASRALAMRIASMYFPPPSKSKEDVAQ